MKAFFSLYSSAFARLPRNVWILSITMFINRSGSMVLLFTSLYLTKNLGLSLKEAGLVMSFYGIGSVLGSYAGGWLTDRKNFNSIMLFSLISSGLVLLLMLIARHIVFVGAIVFVYALLSDMFRPANSAAIAAYSSSENRTRSVSLVRLAINLGFSVGPAVGGFVAMHLGYKWLFVIDACSSFGAAAMLFFYLPEVKNERSVHHKQMLADNKTSAYRDSWYLFFVCLVALYGMIFFQLFASIPQYFSKACHYSEDTIGLLLALNGLLVVVIEMPLITYLGHHDNIFRFIIMGVMCLPVSFAFLLFGKAMIIWAIVYTLFITMSEIFAMPFMMNFVLSRPLKERQGQYSALYSIAYGIANISAPVVGLGLAERFGFDVLFLVLIGLSLLLAYGFNLLRIKQHLL